MKTMKSILLVAIIAFSSVLTASTNPSESNHATTAEPNVITKEVRELLKNPSFIVDHDIFANVTLTINKNNEIVVLSVDSDDSSVEDYIKGRLNYSELPVATKNNGRTFIVPVRLEADVD